MKNMNLIFKVSLAIMLFTTACGTNTNDAETQVNSDIKITYVDDASADGAEKYVASLAIEGMSCEMMCGSKIASTLKDLDGVKQADIDFTEMGERSFAMVEFDSKVVSEKEMIAAVNAIADGIYQVKEVKVTHYKPGAAANTTKVEKEVASFQTKVRYKLPNVFSALVRLF